MMSESRNVPEDRVRAIIGGDETRCRPHEAVAAIRSGLTVESGVKGERPVKLTEFALRHYVCGERRKDNAPKISNLCDFPLAVKAIRFPESVRHSLKGQGVIPDEHGRYPDGTQTEYIRRPYRKLKLVASAYTDNGVLSGWRIQ